MVAAQSWATTRTPRSIIGALVRARQLTVVVTVVGVATVLGACGDPGTEAGTPPAPPSAAATTTTVPGGPAPATSGVAANRTVAPGPGLQWQWELDHPLSTASARDMGLDDSTYTGAAAGKPSVYDLDGFDTPAATVAALHALGDLVICYIDVGTAENWRPDDSRFPPALLGKDDDWPGERWLDTDPAGPSYRALQAIMTTRFEMCQAKGFDAVEPDNIDGSQNETGFAISDAQQDSYDEWVARTVHSLGMGVAQKNFESQAATLEPFFDFALVEECFQSKDCGDLAPYTRAGKAVLEVEYSDQGAQPAHYCPAAIADHFSSVELDSALDGRVRVPCAP
jgi:hypothetical protein